MSERTLVLVKPDGVERGLVGEVVSRIERKGLRLVSLELKTVDRGLAEQHYAEHEGKGFYEELISFITSAPVAALVVEGPRADRGVPADRRRHRPRREGRPRLDPRRPRPGDRVEHRARLGLARVRRARDQALVRVAIRSIPSSTTGQEERARS